jgi:hypothetical protein
VLPVNDAPTVHPVAEVELRINSLAQTLTLTGISAGLANESDQQLALSVQSDNPVMIPLADLVYHGDGTATLRFTPAQSQTLTGPATLTVTIRDNGGRERGGEDTRQLIIPVRFQPTNNAVFMPNLFTPNGDLGVSLFNANRPNASFTEKADRMATNLVLNGGYRRLRKGAFDFTPTFRYIRERSLSQTNIGALSRFNFDSPGGPLKAGGIGLGTWYSVNNAAIVSLEITQPSYFINFSYDLPATNKTVTRRVTNAVEVSIGWTMDLKAKRKAQKELASEARQAPVPARQEPTPGQVAPAGQPAGRTDSQPATTNQPAATTSQPAPGFNR